MKQELNLNIPKYVLHDSLNREFLNLKNNKEEIEIKGNYKEVTIKNINSKEINILIKENSYVIITLLVSNNINEFNININSLSNSNFELFLADISLSNSKININSSLDEVNSKGEIYVSSLGINDSNKNYNINFIHNNKNTYSKAIFKGISKDNSLINVNEITHIKENNIKSEAYQNIKITLLDKTSKGIGHPILKIDNDDIKASHGCAIGNIKESDLYYILSRGIKLKDAKRLITLGNLITITNKMDEESKNEFINYVGEKL